MDSCTSGSFVIRNPGVKFVDEVSKVNTHLHYTFDVGGFLHECLNPRFDSINAV